MPHGGLHTGVNQGTIITDPTKSITEQKILTPKEQCKFDGGVWDEKTQTCIRVPKPPVEPPKADATQIEKFIDPVTGRPSGVTRPGGPTHLGLSQGDVELLQRQQAQRAAQAGGAAPVGTAQAASDAAFRGEQQVGQIGQFGELGLSQGPILDKGEAIRQGLVGSIPSALRSAGQFGVGAAVLGGAARGAAIGTVGAPATGGISIAAGAAIGAAVGLVSGIIGGMISNFKSQRADNTTGQQRILDEGKQSLQDYATMAKADPINRAQYLALYNQQLALIDQAYRQMKFDTSRDVAKFETAVPNLAEFIAFYSVGGEKQALDLEMRNSLLAQSPSDYGMIELAFRRRDD